MTAVLGFLLLWWLVDSDGTPQFSICRLASSQCSSGLPVLLLTLLWNTTKYAISSEREHTTGGFALKYSLQWRWQSGQGSRSAIELNKFSILFWVSSLGLSG